MSPKCNTLVTYNYLPSPRVSRVVHEVLICLQESDTKQTKQDHPSVGQASIRCAKLTSNQP